jgi:hypothetical protein
VKGKALKPLLWAAILILVGAGGFCYGFLSNESRLPPYPEARRVLEWSRNQIVLRRAYYFLRGRDLPESTEVSGSWHPLDQEAGPVHPGWDSDKAHRDFQALGYLSGYEPATGLKGVTVYLKARACEGLNLITSGHGQEAVLTDMNGRVLHRWAYEFSDAFPRYSETEGRLKVDTFFKDFWRRCYLYPDGDLLAIYDGFGMIKLDRDSRLLWAVNPGCHHDVFVDTGGLIYVLTRELRMMPRLNPRRQVLEDFIAVLNPQGELVRKVSVVNAIGQSSYASFLDCIPDIPDMLHTNTVQVLDGTQAFRSPIFKKGNVLISVRNINMIGIVDMDTEKVVWALSGQWLAQHEPTLLPNGDILLFDNRGNNGMSKVIEFDPFTQEIKWAYEGTPENGFYTESSGAAQRLPNGNTLIVQSNSGRAFEVNMDDEIVWEYYSPYRAGENDRLIATLFDVVRLEPGYVATWLKEPAVAGGTDDAGE